jgi:hypothetical protein
MQPTADASRMLTTESIPIGADSMDQDTILIVSGLPRSGTSMMMKMLESAGVPVLTDNIRTADQDNPKGYYEFEQVKQIKDDKTWLPEAQGKAVKMVAGLLKHLPADYAYKIIFMQRDMDEILASQRQMLIRRGEAHEGISDDRMGTLFRRHIEQVQAWLATQPNIEVLYVHYGKVLAEPVVQAERINRFLGNNLDVNKMVEAVDPNLYRQRQ